MDVSSAQPTLQPESEDQSLLISFQMLPGKLLSDFLMLFFFPFVLLVSLLSSLFTNNNRVNWVKGHWIRGPLKAICPHTCTGTQLSFLPSRSSAVFGVWVFQLTLPICAQLKWHYPWWFSFPYTCRRIIFNGPFVVIGASTFSPFTGPGQSYEKLEIISLKCDESFLNSSPSEDVFLKCSDNSAL